MTLSFTPDSAALLLASAASLGLPPSPAVACLRLYIETFLARDHPGVSAPPPPPLPPELAALRQELNRLGNNLNQAVHLAHATRAGLPSQTLEILSELLALLRVLDGRILDIAAGEP